MRTLFSQILSISVICTLSSSCGEDTRPGKSNESKTSGLNTVDVNDEGDDAGDDEDSEDHTLKTIDFEIPEESGSNDNDGGDESTESQCKHIDFLFVIDDSGSMADEQQNLRQSVPQFINAIKGDLDLESFQLGVVSSDQYALNSAPCSELGGFVISSTDGTCGPYEEGNNFMTQEDDLSETFVCAAALGTDGDTNERPMEAMTISLSDQLECNEGFVREEALLVVTIITDEEDDHIDQDPNGNSGSQGNPEDWYRAVIDAKDGVEENAVALSLVGIPKPNACPPFQWDGFRGAEINTRIREFIDMFNERGFVGDVCANSYGPFFEEVIDVIEQACEDFIPP